MHIKAILPVILPACAGALLGYGLLTVYWNFDPIPTRGYSWIVSSSLGRTLHEASPDLDIPMLVAVKAFPFSVLVGLIVGSLLPRTKFQRVLCCAVMLWPFAYFSWGYYVLSQLDSFSPSGAPILREQLSDQGLVAFSVYGWYFLALYIALATARYRITRRSTQALEAPVN